MTHPTKRNDRKQKKDVKGLGEWIPLVESFQKSDSFTSLSHLLSTSAWMDSTMGAHLSC